VCPRTEHTAIVRHTLHMDWIAAAAEWKYFKNEVRAQWRNLTEAQLHAIAGRRAALEEQIRASYDLTQDQAEQQIREFEASNHFLRTTSCR
jgi:uncharacterized protein YjbJ (UPF0337 family)